jgi:predicted AlkP superfamily pyrophosphatase or phosphodiesterase
VRRISILLGLVVWVCGCGVPPAPPAPDDRPPLLLISIDGFRHDYRARTATPHLDRLAGEGVVADGLVPTYPTKTFTAHWSLVTGLYTENHGVVSNNMWDPQRQQSFRLSDRDAVSDPRWYEGEPIWRTAERQGLTAATFFWPGSEAPVGGAHATYWTPFDAAIPHAVRIGQVLAWLDLPASERPDFITLYFSHVDSLGHRHGPESNEVTRAIEAIDADLGQLLGGLETRGLLGAMHILVVSDHGMSEIDAERYIWLDDYLSLNEVRVSDWGPAAHIWATAASVDSIVDALEGAHPRLRVWRREETPAHYRFRNHPRIPDVLAEADHGWMIAPRRAREAIREDPTLGMHGWDPRYRDMHGIFIGHGPAFRPGATMPGVESVHVYDLMAHLLDIDPAPNDGDAAAFRPLLRDRR